MQKECDRGSDGVWDHCNVKRKFRRAAHNSYDLDLKQRNWVPIFFFIIWEEENRILWCKPFEHEQTNSLQPSKPQKIHINF